jgi:ribonuclease P protein component
VIRRLLRSADFERVLRSRTWASSMHFAVHHVADAPGALGPPRDVITPAQTAELSTGRLACADPLVDDFVGPAEIWLGAVVPKRHARRAVTRTLFKRQIRVAVSQHGKTLARGLWVVRLRAPFDRAMFVSAASDALKCAVRLELEQLLGGAARRAGRA